MGAITPHLIVFCQTDNHSLPEKLTNFLLNFLLECSEETRRTYLKILAKKKMPCCDRTAGVKQNKNTQQTPSPTKKQQNPEFLLRLIAYEAGGYLFFKEEANISIQ